MESPNWSEFARAGSRPIRKQCPKAGGHQTPQDCQLTKGLRLWRRGMNSDAKNGASCGVRLERISARGVGCRANSTVTVSVGDAHGRTFRARPHALARCGQGGRIFWSWLGAAWMLVAAWHGGRCGRHEQHWHKLRVNTPTVGMIMPVGSGWFDRLLGGRRTGLQRKREPSWYVRQRQRKQHNSGDESLFHSQRAYSLTGWATRSQ
jgi:hypothetical protein